jgi:glycosyltransferase involved in cell wall biosynthesis
MIVPTYQEEDYIKETLVSLSRAQSRGISKCIQSEIIVVDSGTDRTLELATPIADKTFRVAERGVSRARNLAALKASGNILLFFDADVTVPVNLLEDVLRTFEEKKVVAAVSRVQPFGQAYEALTFSQKLFYALDDVFVRNSVKSRLLLRFYNRGDVLAVRRNAFFDAGGFNENLAILEITELVLKLSEAGKIALLKTVVYESSRRLKQWGLMKSYLLWWKNYGSYYLRSRPFDRTYESVR